MPVPRGGDICREDLERDNLIIIGTKSSNELLREFEEKKVYAPAEACEGYSIKVTKSIYNPDAQFITISGFDARDVMYDAVDFEAYYIPFAENALPQYIF